MVRQEAGRVPRILVVDDDPDLHVFVGRVLSDAGYKVEMARAGREALEKIGAHRPDLILLDLVMAGLDGWGLLEALRQFESPPPVVVLTVCDDFTAVARGIRERVAAFIAKPFHFGDLIATCRKVLETPVRQQRVETERRKEERRHVIVGVRVRSRTGALLASGELVELSPSGARVRLPVQLNVGAGIRLAPHLSLQDIPLPLQGEVKWRAGQSEAFFNGLAFVGLSPAADARLKDLFRSPGHLRSDSAGLAGACRTVPRSKPARERAAR